MAFEITLFMSGGSNNRDPNLSLGGEISNAPMFRGLNNLFDNFTTPELNKGSIDFRCLYLKNTSASIIIDSKIWINSEVAGGAFIELAIDRKNDRQQIAIMSENNGPTGGSFTITFDGVPVVVNYNSNMTTWASNFQNGLLSATDLTDVTITGSNTSSGGKNYILFTVDFINADGLRNQPLIQIASNDLTGDDASISVNKLIQGSPIGASAVKISSSNVSPNGIASSASENGIFFHIPTITSPIELGKIEIGEQVAIWVKRQVTASNIPLADDGFSLGMRTKTEL